MRTTEIVQRLQRANFTAEQAIEIASILEDTKDNAVTKENVDLVASQAKYDLVKWIVVGVIAIGIVATFLKYLG